MSIRTLVSRRLIFISVAMGLVIVGATGCTSVGPAPAQSTPSGPRAVPTEAAPAVPVPSVAPSASESQLFHPEVGQCIDVRKDRTGGRESIVGCDEVHDDEAYADFTLNSNHGAEYPGEAAVEKLATDGCQDRFRHFIGIPYEDSVFEFFPMFPSEASWAERGDRRVTCLVWYPADSLTASLEGAGY